MALDCECPQNKSPYIFKQQKNILFLQFGGQNIDTVHEYKYLGIYLSKSGSFKVAKQHIAEQANKALFTLLKKSKGAPF